MIAHVYWERDQLVMSIEAISISERTILRLWAEQQGIVWNDSQSSVLIAPLASLGIKLSIKPT